MRRQGVNRTFRGVGPRALAPVAVTCIVATVLFSTGTVAQTPAKPDQITRKARLRGDADPNVKIASGVNVRGRPSDAPAPAVKSTTGRPLCSITFDNHTDLHTKAYVDGQFAGATRPYGELSASAIPGTTVLYARAEYEDGSADAWGPIRISCKTKYSWRLVD